jgi:Domain of unknown function (DUF5666)
MEIARKIRASQGIASVVALALVFMLTACGGGGSNDAKNPMPPSPTGSASSTAVTVNIGDAPSDRVISFEITVNSITLTKSDNSTVTLLSTPRRVEVTHLAGTAEPLVLTSIPQGSYTSATISVSAPEVVFIDNTGRPVEREFPTFTKTVTVNFNPPLVVGTTPLVLTLDANVGASVTIDPVTGTVTISPTFNVTNLPLPAAGHDDDQRPENGELDHIVGQLTNVGASQFTIKLGQSGMTLTFNVNSQTRFDDFGGLSALPANALLRVEGITQQDGMLLAKEVELLAGEAMETEGLVTSVTGNPATSFTFVIHDASGTMMNSAMLGTTVSVSIDSRTEFAVDADNIDLSALSLPAFSASTLSKGQRVEAESETENEHGMTGTVRRVKLEQQALTGTVSALSSGQFTLTVADDSAFKLLTGKSTITVFTQRNTEVRNVNLSNGLSVRVRGLLFFDPSRATYTLVAGRITNP